MKIDRICLSRLLVFIKLFEPAGGYEELQAPENLAARLGVMGGLAGLALVASRGRLVWSAAGAGTGAAICYPQSFQAIGQSAYNGER